MEYKTIRYERATLYDEVWSEPVTQVAKRYDISDVGLRKICKKLDVPLPPLGYWRKVETGRAPPRPPLPPHSGLEVIERVRRSTDPAQPAPKPEAKEVLDAQAFESLPENQVGVAGTLRGCHPLITATVQGLEKPHIDGRGVTSPAGPSTLDMSVTKPNQRRALLILNALLQAAESRNWRVIVTKELPRRTVVDVNGEPIAVRLIERTKRSDRPLTPDEERRKRYEKDWRPWNPWTYSPTNHFTLQLLREGSVYSDASFSDANGRPLESQLNGVLVGFVRESVRRKEAREVARLYQIAEEKARRARWEREEQIRQEQTKFKALEEEVSFWERAARIRAYVAAVEARAQGDGGEPSSELTEWAQWARHRADCIDPLCDVEEPDGEDDSLDWNDLVAGLDNR